VALAVFVGVTLYALAAGEYPHVFGFTSSQTDPLLDRLARSPVHLSDDVMISLRAGEMFEEVGYPGFNRTDRAQPSTSYLAPYLYAVLRTFLSEYHAVWVYAVLGLLCTSLTLAVIARTGTARINALILVLGVGLTTTNALYALLGWDHLFQGLFLVLAASLVLKRDAGPHQSVLTGILLALGSLFRPDGILIACGIAATAFLKARRRPLRMLGLAGPFLGIVGFFLVLHYLEFGYLTPTTTRLKVGGAPDLEYAVLYWLRYSFLEFSIITMSMVLLVLCWVYRRTLVEQGVLPILAGCMATFVIAVINSDYFPGGRMFWSTACVLSVVVGSSLPSFARLDLGELREALPSSPLSGWPSAARLTTKVAVVLVALGVSLELGRRYTGAVEARIEDSIIDHETRMRSAPAEHYVLVDWIRRNLTPEDGAIGYFYLGVSYHLPEFEAADFLGKADEMIALRPPSRPGVPGHNKWDIDGTLRKWDPQVIITTYNADVSLPETAARVECYAQPGAPHAYFAELVGNRVIATTYSYCYLKAGQGVAEDLWGFFVREDIVGGHLQQLDCRLREVASRTGPPLPLQG
jgi:hypothetical protein